MGLLKLGICHLCWLPAALVITPFLFMANRRTKERFAVALSNGEQGDFKIELKKFLHNHLVGCAAGIGHGCIPGLVQLFWGLNNALAFARGAHHGFDNDRPAQRCRNLFQFFGIGCIGKASCAKP